MLGLLQSVIRPDIWNVVLVTCADKCEEDEWSILVIDRKSLRKGPTWEPRMERAKSAHLDLEQGSAIPYFIR